MDAGAIASIIVALIALIAAGASQRSASKAAGVAAQASVSSTQITSRVDMEKEAYERARSFDTETITRQNREIASLRAELETMERDLALAQKELRVTQIRVNHLERLTNG